MDKQKLFYFNIATLLAIVFIAINPTSLLAVIASFIICARIVYFLFWELRRKILFKKIESHDGVTPTQMYSDPNITLEKLLEERQQLVITQTIYTVSKWISIINGLLFFFYLVAPEFVLMFGRATGSSNILFILWMLTLPMLITWLVTYDPKRTKRIEEIDVLIQQNQQPVATSVPQSSTAQH